jgi:hypothetical protein
VSRVWTMLAELAGAAAAQLAATSRPRGGPGEGAGPSAGG